MAIEPGAWTMKIMPKLFMEQLKTTRLAHPKHATTAGFSLMEMLVVVAIIAVLFGIAAPSWLSIINNRRANTIQDQVATAFRTAQNQAQRTRRPYTVCLYPNEAPLPVVAVEEGYMTNCPAADVSADTQLGYGELAPDVVAMTAPVTVVNFTETGALDDRNEGNLPITVTLDANGAGRCVTVQTLLGAITTAKEGEPGCPP
jgi:prepilin-type N-terminal cleavage/methylation domain-containing protein